MPVVFAWLAPVNKKPVPAKLPCTGIMEARIRRINSPIQDVFAKFAAGLMTLRFNLNLSRSPPHRVEHAFIVRDKQNLFSILPPLRAVLAYQWA